MQGLRPSQSVRGINQKLSNLESSQDTVNGVRATLSKSQETTSRNIETLKTDLHDAVKKSTPVFGAYSHVSPQEKTAPVAALLRPILH